MLSMSSLWKMEFSVVLVVIVGVFNAQTLFE